MRISDWSSDVCSSDLLLLTFAPAFDDHSSPAAPLFAPFSFLTDGPLAVGIFFVLSGIVLAVAVDAAVDRAPGWRGRAGFAGLVVKRWQIGRASCRERVGPAV